MGAKIFQALETDVQEELKNSFLVAREDLLNNYASITPEELEIFLQVKGFCFESYTSADYVKESCR